MQSVQTVKHTLLDNFVFGKENCLPIEQGDQKIISQNPRISITNHETHDKKTLLIFDLADEHVPFFLQKREADHPHSLKKLNKTSEPNQFKGTFQRGDTIQILKIEKDIKRELLAATVKIAGLRKDGSITIEYSKYKWNGLLVK